MRASSPLTRLFGAVLTARQQFTAYTVLRSVIVKSSTGREISRRIPELAATLVALSMETSSPGRATWIVTLNKDTLGPVDGELSAFQISLAGTRGKKIQPRNVSG